MIVELLTTIYQALRNRRKPLKIKEDMSVEQKEIKEVPAKIFVWSKTERAGNIVTEDLTKSDGNFITVNQIKNDFNGQVVRLSILSTHYKQPLDWNLNIMETNKKILNNWYSFLPFLSQTQQCHGFSPLSFSVKLISSFGLGWLHSGQW